MSRHRPPRPAGRRGSLLIGTAGIVLGIAAATMAMSAQVPASGPSGAASPLAEETGGARVAAEDREAASGAPSPDGRAAAATSPVTTSTPGEEPPPATQTATPEPEPVPRAAPEPVAPASEPAAPRAAGGAGGGPAGGTFGLLPPDGGLPSGEECAARVQRDPWEPRPGNARANATRPTGTAPYGMGTWFTAEADGAAYRGRVDGDFTGTTDEIIQWASCKWGFPTDLSRAQAVAETTWNQAFVGDSGESFGLFQMRRGVWGGHPNSATSTAFNAEWALGLRRACYDGAMWYAQLRGDLEACIGVHYSGDPDPSSWRRYVDSVLRHERDKPWLTWHSAAGRPPTADRN